MHYEIWSEVEYGTISKFDSNFSTLKNLIVIIDSSSENQSTSVVRAAKLISVIVALFKLRRVDTRKTMIRPIV